MMPHGNTFRQFENAVNPVLSCVALIALKISLVGLKPHIADVEDSGGPQNPGDFGNNVELSLIAGHTSQYCEKQNSVDRSIRQRNAPKIVQYTKLDGRITAARASDHCRSWIEANKIFKALGLQNSQCTPISASVIEYFVVLIEPSPELLLVYRMGKSLRRSDLIPIFRLKIQFHATHALDSAVPSILR